MAKGIFIIGTDTDVGKTFVTAGITYILRKKGYNACSYKPLQSGSIWEGDRLISGDVRFVQEITGIEESHEAMNRYCLKEEVSPHLAAEIEGMTVEKGEILGGYRRLEEKYEFIVVEGCGGIVVPLIRGRYYVFDLIKDLELPVVIIARAGVGTINHTVLTVEYIKKMRIEIKGLVINGYQGAIQEKDNIEVIKAITGLEIISVLKKIDADNHEDFITKSRLEYETNIKIERTIRMFA